MLTIDETQTFLHAAFAKQAFDGAGDVEVIAPVRRFKPEMFGKRFHLIGEGAGLEHFHQSFSDELNSGASGLFSFWLPPSPRLRRTGRFSSVAGFSTCSFAEASPKTKNPRGSSPHLFCQCSSALALSMHGSPGDFNSAIGRFLFS